MSLIHHRAGSEGTLPDVSRAKVEAVANRQANAAAAAAAASRQAVADADTVLDAAAEADAAREAAEAAPADAAVMAAQLAKEQRARKQVIRRLCALAQVSARTLTALAARVS